jgi:hypothetical protein
MSKQKTAPMRRTTRLLSIEELETALRLIDRGEMDLNIFWDANISAFRHTVLVSIRETSDALLSPTIPLRWRVTLQSQLDALVHYLELADRYAARRCFSLSAEVEPPAVRAPMNRAVN